ncbi:MAG: nitroreductase [Bacteroidales bacterium]|nr:nitroreductase [Bacteroidales bacterium]
MTLFGKIKNAAKANRAMRNDWKAFKKLQKRYNASLNNEKDRVKQRYLLLRETHTIEKGMSLRNPRKGFGKGKAMHLIEGVQAYKDRFGFDGFMEYPIRVLRSYINYTEASGVEIPDIKKMFGEIDIALSGSKVEDCVLTLSKEECSGVGKDFEALLNSRHSIRYFKDEPVGKELIDKALRMASRTPSACNRQAWRTHVYSGRRAHALLQWQGGCRGFEDEIGTAILVTADLRAFLYYEQGQAYIDGGLYAMNLINALHSEGLGTIPLSCGFTFEKLESLKEFGVPEYEVPILIIGTGVMEDMVKVPVSDRRPIESTNIYH